jgi:hypothetical protein
MQEKDQTMALSFDKVCGPRLFRHLFSMLVDARKALCKGFEGSYPTLIHDQIVDHVFVELWFKKLTDV